MKKIMDLFMQAILVSMALLLLILETIIKSLMVLENRQNLFILPESPKKKEDLFVFMNKKSMDSMMVTLFLSDKFKEWVKSMENNSK